MTNEEILEEIRYNLLDGMSLKGHDRKFTAREIDNIDHIFRNAINEEWWRLVVAIVHDYERRIAKRDAEEQK